MSTARNYQPGDRVRLDRDVYGTVVPNSTPVTDRIQRITSPAECVKVREDTPDGLVRWWNRSRMTLIEYAPIAATEYPVGATVRVTSNGAIGGRIGTVVLNDGHVLVSAPGTPSGRKDGAWWVAPADLERVHILTHEELTTIDAGLLRGSVSGNEERALDVTDKHLRPAVTRTFAVTIEQPADRPEVTLAGLIRVIAGDGTLHSSAKVTVTEEQTR
jgi:hypothetical protein